MQPAIRQGIRAELESCALDPYCVLFLPLYRLDGDSFASQDKYGHLCTNHGSVWSPRGRKVTFAGQEYIDCGNGDSLDVLGTITLLMVVNGSMNSEYEGGGISRRSGTTAQYKLGIGAYGGVLYANSEFDMSGGSLTNAQAIPLTPGLWYHIAVTYDLTTIRFYKDGVLVKEVEGKGNLSHVGSHTLIAKDDYITPRWIEGTIPLAMLFSRALTPQEISRHAMAAQEAFG